MTRWKEVRFGFGLSGAAAQAQSCNLRTLSPWFGISGETVSTGEIEYDAGSEKLPPAQGAEQVHLASAPRLDVPERLILSCFYSQLCQLLSSEIIVWRRSFPHLIFIQCPASYFLPLKMWTSKIRRANLWEPLDLRHFVLPRDYFCAAEAGRKYTDG